jgi:hypothetical protein
MRGDDWAKAPVAAAARTAATGIHIDLMLSSVGSVYRADHRALVVEASMHRSIQGRKTGEAVHKCPE